MALGSFEVQLPRHMARSSGDMRIEVESVFTSRIITTRRFLPARLCEQTAQSHRGCAGDSGVSV